MRQEAAIESILDLNSTNVWKLTEQDIKKAWDAEKEEGSFATSEDKLLNIIRLSFDVVHYNPADPREKAKYENGEWATFQHCNEKRGWVAVRKKYITRLTDLSYENIHHHCIHFVGTHCQQLWWRLGQHSLEYEGHYSQRL
jgi:hypothetical protein